MKNEPLKRINFINKTKEKNLIDLYENIKVVKSNYLLKLVKMYENTQK